MAEEKNYVTQEGYNALVAEQNNLIHNVRNEELLLPKTTSHITFSLKEEMVSFLFEIYMPVQNVQLTFQPLEASHNSNTSDIALYSYNPESYSITRKPSQ